MDQGQSDVGIGLLPRFYILSLRGDTIITRDFRGDVVKGTAEIFFRKAISAKDACKIGRCIGILTLLSCKEVKFWHGDAPPIFNLDGVGSLEMETEPHKARRSRMLLESRASRFLTPPGHVCLHQEERIAPHQP